VAEKFEAYVAVVKASGATDPKAALAARCRDLTLTHPKVTLLEPRPPEGASVASAVPITSPLISTDCDEAAARAWEAVWEALRETMYENSFQEWIAPLTCLGFKSGATLPVLVVGTVSPFHRQWVEESFGEELAAAIAGVRAGLWLEGLTVEILTTDEADSVEIAQNFAV